MSSTQKPASSTQVGGDHYRLMKIQPSHFIRANNLGWYEGNIVKYICRHASKGKKLDVEKVIHYAQLLLEEYDDTAQADASLPSRSG